MLNIGMSEDSEQMLWSHGKLLKELLLISKQGEDERLILSKLDKINSVYFR